MNDADLNAKLVAAAQQVAVGATYQHYKQKLYTVANLALLEETLEPCVVYQAQYGEHLTFIRPLTDWLATVEVDGQATPRFTKVAV